MSNQVGSVPARSPSTSRRRTRTISGGATTASGWGERDRCGVPWSVPATSVLIPRFVRFWRCSLILDQGAIMGSRCVWNVKFDGYASSSYQNDTLFAVGVLYAVYLEWHVIQPCTVCSYRPLYLVTMAKCFIRVVRLCSLSKHLLVFIKITANLFSSRFTILQLNS